MSDCVISSRVLRTIKMYTGRFEAGEDLKLDGSNFIDWFKRLCDMLKSNNQIVLIREWLGEEPEDPEAKSEYLDRRACAASLRYVMRRCMVNELQVRYPDPVYPDSMIRDLKKLFTEQLRLGEFDYLKKFLSTKMEENTHLGTHLCAMEDLRDFLTQSLIHWIPEDLAVNVLLQSLPPSYGDFVDEYVRQDGWCSFQEVQDQLLDLEAERLDREYLKKKGIYLIYFEGFKC